MQTLDLEKLPDFAKLELQDFYQFLLQKYANELLDKSKESEPLAPRLVKPFVPLARDTLHER